MNNAVKDKKNNNNARKKVLVLKLRFGAYLMATLTISSKKHSMRGCPLSFIKQVSLGLASEYYAFCMFLFAMHHYLFDYQIV